MRSARKPDILVDLCSQRDFLFPGGTHVCTNVRDAVQNIKHLMAFARWAHVPTLSCVEARRLEDVRGVVRPECVVGSLGQRKLPCTLLPNRVLIDSDNCLCVSLDVFEAYQQVILCKEHRDPFTNPKLDRLLTELPQRRFVVFGVALETCVRLVSLGLMLRHQPVTVVYDACGWWDAEGAEMTLRQLEAKSCTLVSTRQYVTAACGCGRGAAVTRPTRWRDVA